MDYIVACPDRELLEALCAFTPEVQDHRETVERNSGRRERRTCTVLGGPGLCEWVADPEAWPGLRSPGH